MSKALIIGDIHLSRKRIHRSKMLLDKILEQLSCKPEYLILLGDVFDEHESVDNDCLSIYSDFIQKASRIAQCVHLLGNHEMNDSKTLLPEHHSLKPWVKTKDSLDIVEKPLFKNIDGTRVGFFPYAPPGQFSSMVTEEIDLAFAHQEFKGCMMAKNSIASEHGDPLPGCQVISGHIHGYQKIGNIWYPGTPCQQNFGESLEKRIFLIEIANGGYTVLESIDLGMPKYRTIKTTIPECGLIERNEADTYRFEIEASPSQIFGFKKSETYRKLAGNVKFKFSNPKKVETILPVAENASFEQRFLEIAKTNNCVEAYENIFGRLS